MLRSTFFLCGLFAVNGCSQYALHAGTSTGKPDPVDTAEASGTAGTDATDTAGLDVCYDPEFGYDPNPAARLFTTDGSTPWS